MQSLAMSSVAVTDFTEEMFYKMQNVEKDKIVEYCNNINESAAESAKNVTNGVKTIFAKIIANVFEEVGDDGKNPMMIDLIVRNTLKFLCPQDLFASRLVCRLWNSEVSTLFRSSQRVSFHPESPEKLMTFTAFTKASSSAFSSQSQFPQNGTVTFPGPPFSTFSFTSRCSLRGGDRIPSSPSLTRKVMLDFIQNCGQYVQNLELFYPDDAPLENQDFLAFFLQGMPNLKSIHFINLPTSLTQLPLLKGQGQDPQGHQYQPLTSLSRCRIDRPWEIEKCWSPSFLRDLLSLMPNLRDYEVWTWNSLEEDALSEPYFLSLPGGIHTLRPGSFGDALGSTLGQQLKLTTLHLPVLNRDISPETVESLLLSQAATLEELQLNLSSMKDKTKRLLSFPKMKKLKSLQITITYPWNNDYTPFSPGIQYAQNFPSLQILKLEVGLYNDQNLVNYFFPQKSVTSSSSSVTELDLSFSGFRDEKFIKNQIADLFPSLKTLRLDGFGSRIVQQIFTHLQNLECLELYLIYGFNLDDQMTGIPKELCAQLRKEPVSKLLELKVEDLQVTASLASLSKLRTLSIKQKDYHAKFWPEAQCVTNISAVFVISRMKHLRKLHIQSVKFSEDCVLHLRNSLEDCWIDFA